MRDEAEKEQQSELPDAQEQPASGRGKRSDVTASKDLWDKVSSLTPLLIGIFVTAGGTYLGQLHNWRQDKLAEVAALEKFHHLLVSASPSERELGYASFAALGYEKLAIKLSSLTGDQASKPVLENIKQTNPSLSSQADAALKKILRISFLVNGADAPAAQRIDSLRGDFEDEGFDWQPPKKDVRNSPEKTEIRIAGPSDRQLAEHVQKILKQKYSIDTTIDPQSHPDVGSGYVQVSLAKGALQ
jgi:hypothetical protein